MVMVSVPKDDSVQCGVPRMLGVKLMNVTK